MAEFGPYTEAQDVTGLLTPAAIFLTVSVADHATTGQIKEFLAGMEDLVKNVNFRDPEFSLTCVVGLGSQLWELLTRAPVPQQLHPFVEIRGQRHVAPATPGDIFFHLRANRIDLCFELEKQILDVLGALVQVEDETVGFRYFEARDLLGFVDGTANPRGQAQVEAALIGDREPLWSQGSYLMVQKYVHQLGDWEQLSTAEQEAIIGRTKLSNIELDDAPPAEQKSHKTLSTVEDANGDEMDILRDNMPFGSPAAGEFGTYFIAYAGDLSVTEEMLRRMVVGDPPGKHDRILDFSTPVTGCVFFVPPADFLASLA
ncbi:Dyp-type peroxidase [Scrofimicrobium sp. R131]|uniref:Dyp-type peroxidase n=1 Tax=Scrofimicrobium appendicitidis TaxID=3079930 RepID=A0AAU7V4X1_9ACTO